MYDSNLPDYDYVELSYEDDLKQSVLRVESLRTKLQNLDLSDGVNFDEASTILGNFYFTDEADGCGAPGNIVDRGDHWMAATFIGFAPKRSDPIYINKITGAIKQNNEILVMDPQKLKFEDPMYYVMAKETLERIEGNIQKETP